MADLFTLGLIALSSITGKPLLSFNNIKLSASNYALANLVCNKNRDAEILFASDIFEIDGKSKTALFKFSNGEYVIIDKQLNTVIDNGSNRFLLDSYNSIIVKTTNDYYTFEQSNNSFVSLRTNNILSLDNTLNERDINYHFEPCKSDESPNGTFIQNKSYFDNLNRAYGDNDDGICGIIASEILFGYYDSFEYDDIVPENYDVKEPNPESISQSPSTDYVYPLRTNEFRDYLVDKAYDYNNSNPHLGMSNFQIRNFIESYLEERNIPAEIEFSLNESTYISTIENYIDNDRPVLATVPYHVVIVYGYDDNYFYLDSGWSGTDGGTGRIPKYIFGFGTDSVMALNLEIDGHLHSNNFYNRSNQWITCGCGLHHSTRLIINPSDWEFPGYYSMSSLESNHLLNGVSFYSNRLRTGFIESQVINLSPRKAYAGHAFLNILFQVQIYEVNMKIGWWSENELQNLGSAKIGYHTNLSPDDIWVGNYIDLLSLDLPQSYQNLKNIRVLLPFNTNGFKFDLTNYPVGDRNKGRLSIGQICFDYLA